MFGDLPGAGERHPFPGVQRDVTAARRGRDEMSRDRAPEDVVFAELGALSDADDIDIVARALVGRARPGGLIVTEEPAAADAHPSIVEPLVVAKDRVVLGALTSDDTGLHVALTTFVDGAQTITTRRIDLPGPAEIDRVFGGLGCTLVGRWADWAGTPANDANWHVAVHRTAIGG